MIARRFPALSTTDVHHMNVSYVFIIAHRCVIFAIIKHSHIHNPADPQPCPPQTCVTPLRCVLASFLPACHMRSGPHNHLGRCGLAIAEFGACNQRALIGACKMSVGISLYSHGDTSRLVRVAGRNDGGQLGGRAGNPVAVAAAAVSGGSSCGGGSRNADHAREALRHAAGHRRGTPEAALLQPRTRF